MSSPSIGHRLRVLLYPGLLVGTVSLAMALSRTALPAGASLTLALLALFGGILLLERWLPYVPRWRNGNDTTTDIVHNVAALTVDRLVRVAAEAALAGLAVAAGAGALSHSPWPVQLVVLLLVPDGIKYALHRLSHRWDALWGVHAVHHQPDRVVLLNGLRMHPVNVVWNVLPDVVLVLLAGPDPAMVLAVGALRGAVSLLQHANIDMRAGWLAPWLSTPDAHRWHHARDRATSDANFGATSLLWDLLLGTYRAPSADARQEPMGIDEELPNGWAGQLLWPFCRERLRTTCFTARLREVLR